MTLITRRTALFMFAAPAIVRAASLMKIKALPLKRPDYFIGMDLGERDATTVIAMRKIDGGYYIVVPKQDLVERGIRHLRAEDVVKLFAEYQRHSYTESFYRPSLVEARARIGIINDHSLYDVPPRADRGSQPFGSRRLTT